MSIATQWFASEVQQSGSHVIINKIYLKATDYDYDLSIFMSQIVFWSNGQSRLGMGKFYKSDIEIGAELGFDRHKVMRLKNKLKTHDVGEFFHYQAKKINGTPTTTWSINFEAFCTYFYDKFAAKPAQKVDDAPLQTSVDMESAETHNGMCENALSMDCAKTHNPTLYRSLPDNNLTTCANEFALVDGESNISVSNNQEQVEIAFVELWKGWHNKKNKISAQKAFKKLCKSNGTNPHLIAKDILFDSNKRLNAQQLGFNKIMLSTYINNERWEDDITQDNKPVDKLAQAIGLYV